jgi:hypothetical protein
MHKEHEAMHDGYKVNRKHLNFEVLAQRTQGLCTMDTKLIDSILIWKNQHKEHRVYTRRTK